MQLSPLPFDTWEARTARYARHVDRVTWLFGLNAGQHLFTATVDQHGYALAVKLSSHKEVDAADPATILIGTVTRSDTTWVPLTDCTMTALGISTPHVATAIAEHKVWQAKARAAEQWRLVEGAAKPDGGTSGSPGGSSARDHTTVHHRKRPASSSRTLGGAASRPRGTARHPLASYGWLDSSRWTPEAGWDFLEQLDPQLRPAAKVMAYLVSRIEVSGPDWTLSFPDADDDAKIQAALAHAGIVELYDTPSGIRRWRRPLS